jgi:hypothetical protein
LDLLDHSFEGFNTCIIACEWWRDAGMGELMSGQMDRQGGELIVVSHDLSNAACLSLVASHVSPTTAEMRPGLTPADSMMGYGADKGIIPLTTSELFETVARKQALDAKVSYTVEVSYMEIYNEK